MKSSPIVTILTLAGIVSIAIGVIGIAFAWPTQSLLFFSTLGGLLFIVAFIVKTEWAREISSIRADGNKKDILGVTLIVISFMLYEILIKPTSHFSLYTFFSLLLIMVYAAGRLVHKRARWYDVFLLAGWVGVGINIWIFTESESFGFLASIYTVPVTLALFFVWVRTALKAVNKGTVDSIVTAASAVVPLDRLPFQITLANKKQGEETQERET